MPKELLPQTERVVWDEGGLTSALDKQFRARISHHGGGIGVWSWVVEKEYDHKPGVYYPAHTGYAASEREAKAIVQGVWDAIQRGEL